METIFALASGPPPAAVSVVRLSGPKAMHVGMRLCGRKLVPRQVELVTIRDPVNGRPIDRCLLIAFVGPRSFTGEDIVEFHVHGGRAVVAALLRVLGNEAGCRTARRGEFTRRAFLNGKLDLTASEGLGDLIDSETELQRLQAFSAINGGLAARASTWRAKIVEILALLEAVIDFPDEGDAPESFRQELDRLIQPVIQDMEDLMDDGRRGESIRDGYVVVILGAPNVGKSALMNALAGREVAIVSSRAGTTRDLIELKLDLDGIPVTFIDTAGIRPTEDEIEQEGIRRANESASRSNLILWLSDAPSTTALPVEQDPDKTIFVRTKVDLAGQLTDRRDGPASIALSANTGFGLERLTNEIRNRLLGDCNRFEAPLISRSRQRNEILGALHALLRAREPTLSPELVSEEVRHGAFRLDELMGVINSEDVLDEVFRKFCMGK